MTNNEEKLESSHVLIPSPVLNIVLEYAGLNRQCFFKGHANINVNEILTAYHQLTTALLLHVVRGEQDQAEEIIKANPVLIFNLGTVQDLSGNTFINYSPCQLARYAHDVDMLKMMNSYVNQVEHGEEQFATIIKEADEAAKKQKPYDFFLLAACFTCGDSAQIKEALDTFRNHFRPRAIKNEKSFNIGNLLKAYDVYVNNYTEWSNQQRSLFWRQVIGYLQRSLPACYAQAFCQGLYNVTKGNWPLRRELKLQRDQDFYAGDINEQVGLGFDFAVHSYLTSWPAGGWKLDEENVLRPPYPYLKNLTQIRADELQAQPESRLKSRCLMM
jgi:hypothetical protein